MQRLQLIETLQTMVEEACRSETNVFGYGIWTHHIVYVVTYGKLLAERLGADAEIVEIAALLHDYAGIKHPDSSKDHHLHGALEAERVLRALRYPEDKLQAVKHCILSHRGSIAAQRTTAEAICLASADAMAHIDQVPSLLYLTFVHFNMGIDEGIIWVREKLARSWNKLCPEGQAMMQEKYLAAQMMLHGAGIDQTEQAVIN